MLINIREFQLLSYLGHQLYTFLDVCYIDGEFVDIVWHRDSPCDILWQYVTSFEHLRFINHLRHHFRQRPLIKPNTMITSISIKTSLNYEELDRLFKTPCRHDVLRRASIFAVLSGLHRGDILALDWKDYKRDNKGINIYGNQISLQYLLYWFPTV